MYIYTMEIISAARKYVSCRKSKKNIYTRSHPCATGQAKKLNKKFQKN